MKKLMVEILHIYSVGQTNALLLRFLINSSSESLFFFLLAKIHFSPLPLAIPRETCFQPQEY